jgi:hypothetical protein
MRAIIIDDKDARALLERLQLTQYANGSGRSHINPDEPAKVDEVHGWFRYVVCSWLQEQGANIIR